MQFYQFEQFYLQKQRNQHKIPYNVLQRYSELNSFCYCYLVRMQIYCFEIHYCRIDYRIIYLIQGVKPEIKVLGFKCSKLNVFFFKKALLSFLCSLPQSIHKSNLARCSITTQHYHTGIFWIHYVIKLFSLPFLLLLFLREDPSCIMNKSLSFCKLK